MLKNVLRGANLRVYSSPQSSLLRSFITQRAGNGGNASCPCCYSTAAVSVVGQRPRQSLLGRPLNNVPGPSENGGAVVFAKGEHNVEHALAEAVRTLSTPEQLRLFFVHLLVNDRIASPVKIWDAFQDALARDLILENDNINIGLNETLQELDRALAEHGKSLAHYGLPEPSFHGREVEAEQDKWAPQADSLAMQSANAVALLNGEQHEIYTEVMDAVTHGRPLCAFVDGKAGRGKTFLVNTICNQLRSEGHIVLPTATSAFAAQLYPGGKTTHSVFRVPVDDEAEQLTSPIMPHDPRGELIREASVIIWDEAPMAKNVVLTCVEETCRRVMRNELPFGGKVVVLLGDFRQTCPVIRNGTRQQVVDASIRSSSLWDQFVAFRLHQPIRHAEDLHYADFVDAIGDGLQRYVPLNLLETVRTRNELMEFVYPDDVLRDPERCLARAILAPTNVQVDEYNRDLLKRIEGFSRTYYATDSLEDPELVDDTDPNLILEGVVRQSLSGVPAHALEVKVSGVYRLLCNFAPERGLVKNTRVVVLHVGKNIITVRALRGIAGIGGVGPAQDPEAQDVLVSRIPFSTKLESGHTLVRRQFPLAPAYATTFNSCQGLTLDTVGVDLTSPVFSHGQLYTALSRIRHRSHAKVRLRPGQSKTKNVTYHEVLL